MRDFEIHSPPPPPRVSFPKWLGADHLLRLIYSQNPFYAISTVLVLIGLKTDGRGGFVAHGWLAVVWNALWLHLTTCRIRPG